MKAVVAAFNQEKALVGAFSVITNLRICFGWNFLKHWSLCFNVELKKISFAIHWSSYNYNLIPSILSSWSRRQNKCHPWYKWCQMFVPHTALWRIKVGWRNKNQIENTIWEGEPSASNIHSNYSQPRITKDRAIMWCY